MEADSRNMTTLRVAFYASLGLTMLMVMAFAFAMIAIPPSGPNCPENCMGYPFPDILSYYPRDYIWMYLTVFQLLAFVIFIVANHFNAPNERKVFSFIGVVFGTICATVLLTDYWIQIAVVPLSVMKGETEGIPLLTQYNGHGIFIALEELGFTSMSIAFLFLSPVFIGKSRLEKVMRWLYVVPIVSILFAFVFYTVAYGIDRDYRVEVVAIGIDWTITIVVGILSCIFYRRLLRGAQNFSA